MITLILSGKPITRFTEEKIFLFIRFFSCFNYPVVKNWFFTAFREICFFWKISVKA